MSQAAQWFRNSGPLAKTLVAVTFTTGLVIINRWFYAPYVKRQRYRRAEEWSNYIIEQEEQNENENTNNVTY